MLVRVGALALAASLAVAGGLDHHIRHQGLQLGARDESTEWQALPVDVEKRNNVVVPRWPGMSCASDW